MRNVLDIRLQKLFLVALSLKVLSSFLGWYLQQAWILGFFIPIAIMVIYIVLGLMRHDSDVSDEKFADSCYYLGFIFTITSIIFCLFDLPNIGTQIQGIAVRFGAAMVSTVLGLGVRVYLVSFRRDLSDAIRDAEDVVLESTHKLTQQLAAATDRLSDFGLKVDEAARVSVERVNVQVESLSKNHAEKLHEFFMGLIDHMRQATKSSLTDIHSSSSAVKKSAMTLSRALDNLHEKSSITGDALDAVLNLSKQQQPMFDAAKEQLDALRQLSPMLEGVSNTLSLMTGEISASRGNTSELITRVSAVITNETESRGVLERSLEQIAVKLEDNTVITRELAARIGTNAAMAEQVVSKLNAIAISGEKASSSLAASNTASEKMVHDLRELVAADADAVKALVGIESHAVNTIGHVEEAIGKLGMVVTRLDALERALVSNSNELTRIADAKALGQPLLSTRRGATLEPQAITDVMGTTNLGPEGVQISPDTSLGIETAFDPHTPIEQAARGQSLRTQDTTSDQQKPTNRWWRK